MGLALAAAIAIDQLFGEWPSRIHPVVWFGKAASLGERLAPQTGNRARLVFGGFLALGLPCAAALVTFIALRSVSEWPWIEFVLGVFLLKSTFALRALGSAANSVANPLSAADLDAARRGLANLCSRDPSDLGASELAGAAVESVAENTSDSLVAPVFYAACFGVPGAVFYRAVNTLDAMFGYRNPTYEYLGKASARLDDLLNWVPARLTALLLLVAGAVRGAAVSSGWRVLRADGSKTESPNAGRPMATMAGLLGVELEKRGEYVLGAPGAPPTGSTIDDAWKIARLGALGFVLVVCLSLRLFHA
ncbi:MAG: adenosylcobinamide-phosphate synthase CbiB [Myxococcota bacterium]